MKRIVAIALIVLMLLGVAISVIPALTANSANESLIGDVNGDNVVDNLDAIYVLKYDAALFDLTAAQLALSDVSDDGNTDNLDAAMILIYDAGIIDRFPADKEDETSSIEYPEGAYVVKTSADKNSINWAEVPKAEIDTYKWVNSVEYEAYAQLVYIKDYGFICRMTCIESNPLTNYTQFGDPVYLDSCMEFFAAWDNVSYVNIESNSIGAMCAQFGSTNKNRKPLTDYMAMNEIFAMNPVVESDKWTLTMDIPITKLQKMYGTKLSADTFVPGYTFKGNFYKIGSDAVTGIRHYGMWTELPGNTPNFHQPAYFGTIIIGY